VNDDRRVVLASKNPHKIKEVEAVLASMDHPWKIVRGHEWPDVDEAEDTLEGNALLKATAVSEATGLPAIADDTGLEVDALGGRPGVYSARFAGPEASYEANVDRLLEEMDAYLSENESRQYELAARYLALAERACPAARPMLADSYERIGQTEQPAGRKENKRGYKSGLTKRDTL